MTLDVNRPDLVVGVVGTGAMGRGIAQVTAQGGIRAIMFDAAAGGAAKAKAAILETLKGLVAKGRLSEADVAKTEANLGVADKLDDLKACHVVVEAVFENLEVKQKLFGELEAVVAPETILASNTSSIRIASIARALKHRDRVCGMHYFNPVPLMKLVEVVKTIATAPAVYDAAYEFAKRLGKVPVRTSDKTGFIVNRLLVPYLLDAIRAYEEGVGSIEDIDNAMKLGCGYPMGPFTLLDFVGLDTAYYITHVMYDEFKERRFASPPLLKRMVMAGWYGRKSGKGFYDYADPARPVANRL
jgi:3-hydroxybutyryl-CoA dehydrogenase